MMLLTEMGFVAGGVWPRQDDDVPDGDMTAPGDLGERFNEVVGAAKWVGVAVCVLALIGAFVMMAVSSRSGRMGDEGIGSIAKVLMAVVGIVAAPTIVAFFIT